MGLPGRERSLTISSALGIQSAKKEGVGKFCDFRLKPLSISETERDRTMVAVER